MQITEKQILSKTNYGLDIYAHILRDFYSDETVIHLKGRITEPSKNPFRGNAPTLIFEEIDQQFLFRDNEEIAFTGTPFDFAKLHFKKDGPELLKVLLEVLHLKFERRTNKFPVFLEKKKEITPQPLPIYIPKVSFFDAPVSNTIPSKELTLKGVYELILANSVIQTEHLRQISDKKLARKYKAANFNYVTFSGTFSSRKDDALLKHSGYLAIDFDHIPDLESLKTQLLNDAFFETQMLFKSPSGDGLKWIISIDITQNTHQDWFMAIKNYLEQTYQLKVDSAGIDVSRACFLPNDPQIFINSKHLMP
ncbi:BT4734/BF3469 family protein [Lacihabitans soyangensis]|uniref:VirE protein n=1 Tax=Lacihabitans soyangensis TaxID=869394 RepID=A0AAE3KSQ5_9BACT|nr:BT4734/BF3469 family protein [Lacihabitans soyangensis]MCP9761481.1 VirE protein [Lacihabitans soyangensis]